MDNIPYLPRIKTLLFNNNRICRFGEHLEESLPKLDSLILTNNNVQELADIETLSSVKSLTMLSLLHNPVMAKPNYRAFVVHKFPNLRLLDFKKVKPKEREEAKALFKTKQGKEQLKEIKKRAKTFTPGESEQGGGGGRPATNASGLTPEQVRTIKAAIARATTLEEIERLNHMLRTGQIPGEERQQKKAVKNGKTSDRVTGCSCWQVSLTLYYFRRGGRNGRGLTWFRTRSSMSHHREQLTFHLL